MQDRDDLNTPVIAVIGVVGAVLTFVIIVALQAWFYSTEKQETQRKVVVAANEELSRIVAEQQIQLSSYRVVDRTRGIVAIPIERAMDLIAQEWASGTTRPASTQP